MVKFYSHSHTYEYPLPTVSLAYFLRYPSPYSPHVQSTDVLARTFDPHTQRLTTTRLVLKRSRLPKAILALVPRSLLRANAHGEGQSYILERSVVDVREGWMRTEARNLELRTVLDVIERQTYTAAPPPPSSSPLLAAEHRNGTQRGVAEALLAASSGTDVHTVVTLHSRLGQRFLRQQPVATASEVVEQPATATKTNFLVAWSQARLQRSIEAIGFSRASRSQPNAMEGMKDVLERLRQEGLVKFLEGMKRQRELTAQMGVENN